MSMGEGKRVELTKAFAGLPLYHSKLPLCL